MVVVIPDRAVVTLGDEPVGALVRVGEGSRFEPAESWAELPAGDRPVLGQQFEEDPFSAHLGRSRLGVPPWFEHLLPERDGLLREVIAKAIDVAPVRGYALLLLLGDDLPGAVRIRPADGDDLRTVARRTRDSTSGDAEDDAFLRVSLAGVQLKISARLHRGRLAVPGWDAEGDWIVKFADELHRTLPELEYSTMRWAKAAGLDVPAIRLVHVADIEGIDKLRPGLGETAFAIERYDRTVDGGRVHQEDFAQVLGLPTGGAKYSATNIDTILRVLSVLSPKDVDEMLARIVFSVVSGNDDAHAKNWSLWYPDATVARLSPAYDQVATTSLAQYSANPMSLKIAGARRFEDVTDARLRALGSRANLDPERVSETVRDAVVHQVSAWSDVRDEPEVSSELREYMDRRLESLPLVQEVRLQGAL